MITIHSNDYKPNGAGLQILRKLGDKLDYTRLLLEMKKRSDEEMLKMSKSYGLDFSVEEIRRLRPLLDEISMHWILTGVPESFISKVERILGQKRTHQLLEDYLNMRK